jgi:X-X-X-Leu-X-X-Gly heptad repeat protein
VVNKIGLIAEDIASQLKLIPGIGGTASEIARHIGNSTSQVSNAISELSSGAKSLSKGIQAPKPEPQN